MRWNGSHGLQIAQARFSSEPSRRSHGFTGWPGADLVAPGALGFAHGALGVAPHGPRGPGLERLGRPGRLQLRARADCRKSGFGPLWRQGRSGRPFWKGWARLDLQMWLQQPCWKHGLWRWRAARVQSRQRMGLWNLHVREQEQQYCLRWIHRGLGLQGAQPGRPGWRVHGELGLYMRLHQQSHELGLWRERSSWMQVSQTCCHSVTCPSQSSVQAKCVKRRQYRRRPNSAVEPQRCV
mmetsp:Transcript_64580/g.78984  ORF Transcript_64580/g.78984 Transcript_64580/m.78984 type:complete len:238 (-) Transcript_64580:26-739(-)